MEYIYICNGNNYMMVIYKTTNLVNGKYYIGKQKKYTDRYLGSGSALKDAIVKYGKSQFKKEILEICESETELQRKELEWIDKLNAVKDKKCYNLIRETSSNIHRSYNDPLYREKLSKSVKLAMSRPHVYDKILKNNAGKNNPMYGKKRSEDFKKMISKLHAKKHLSEDTKALIALHHTGKTVSIETKEKMKKSQCKRWNNIVIKVNLDGGCYEFFTRDDFKSFIKCYNERIPVGRVRGSEPKRINWKKALKENYSFIKVIPK